MKLFSKLAILMSVGMFLMSFTGCVKSPANAAEDKDPASGQPNKGITVNNISFEVVEDEKVPDALNTKIQKYKEQRGFLYTEKDGYYYVAILSGLRPTGGYGIEVKTVEDIEGKTKIIVEETAPSPGDFVTQVITYPYTVIKLKDAADKFVVENSGGEKFELIKE
jgi:hypothetical protein